MPLDEETKRKAMSAVSAVQPAIEQVEATGSTVGVNQPALDPELAGLDVGRVPDWRDTQSLEAMRAEKREVQMDMNVPGE